MSEYKTISEFMENQIPGSVKIKYAHWDDGRYFIPYFRETENRSWHGLYCRGIDDSLCHNCFLGNSSDWEIFKPSEKKKKKNLRPCIVKNQMHDQCMITTILYESELAAKQRWGDIFVCMAPDSYAIEVEE